MQAPPLMIRTPVPTIKEINTMFSPVDASSSSLSSFEAVCVLVDDVLLDVEVAGEGDGAVFGFAVGETVPLLEDAVRELSAIFTVPLFDAQPALRLSVLPSVGAFTVMPFVFASLVYSLFVPQEPEVKVPPDTSIKY
jgi:hypothetical protein